MSLQCTWANTGSTCVVVQMNNAGNQEAEEIRSMRRPVCYCSYYAPSTAKRKVKRTDAMSTDASIGGPSPPTQRKTGPVPLKKVSFWKERCCQYDGGVVRS